MQGGLFGNPVELQAPKSPLKGQLLRGTSGRGLPQFPVPPAQSGPPIPYPKDDGSSFLERRLSQDLAQEHKLIFFPQNKPVAGHTCPASQ